MSGKPGNPNHDPKTGRFTSRSGLNRENSTNVQRGKAKVKESMSDAKAYALGAASLAVAGIGAALLQGITRPVRAHSSIIANKAINAGTRHAEQFVAQHGPKITAAIRAKGSTLANHVKNMKSAKPTAQGGSTNVNVTFAKPKVRIKMGSNNISPPKTRTVVAGPIGRATIGKPVYRVPMGRK